MLEWMRRGRDFRQFVVHDIETELYAQDDSSQLLSASCKAKRNFETKVKTDCQSESGRVTQLFVVFSISLRVRAANGVVWCGVEVGCRMLDVGCWMLSIVIRRQILIFLESLSLD